MYVYIYIYNPLINPSIFTKLFASTWLSFGGRTFMYLLYFYMYVYIIYHTSSDPQKSYKNSNDMNPFGIPIS